MKTDEIVLHKVPPPAIKTGILIMVTYLIYFLELSTALVASQVLSIHYNELLVSLPYEFTYCAFCVLAFLFIKGCQTCIAKGDFEDNHPKWIVLLLTIPSAIVLGAAVFACRISAIRKFGQLPYNENQQYELEPIGMKIPRNYTDVNLMVSMSYYDRKSCQFNAWNYVQVKYKCCGIKSARDWLDVRPNVPGSCCNGLDGNCSVNAAFKAGCTPRVYAIFYQQMHYVELFINIIALMELIAFLVFLITALQEMYKPPVESEKLVKLKLKNMRKIGTMPAPLL